MRGGAKQSNQDLTRGNENVAGIVKGRGWISKVVAPLGKKKSYHGFLCRSGADFFDSEIEPEWAITAEPSLRRFGLIKQSLQKRREYP